MDQEMARSRQACEPCRRKKSKCTGEKPVCSFCERLGLECIYFPRTRSTQHVGASRAVKKPSTKDRIRMLESQVSGLSGLLHSLPSNNSEAFGPGNNSRYALGQLSNATGASGTFSETGFDPPLAALKHFVQVYKATLHLQPLPMFNPEDLQARIAIVPQFLLHSFLALMLKFTSHEFYNGKEVEAASLYYRLAADTTMRLAFDGTPRLEVIQSLCLLALKNITDGDPSRACMTIGAAARLDSLHRLQQHDSSQADDLHVRCFWSVYMLETVFFPHVSNALEFDKASKHPLSAEPPPPMPHGNDQVDAPDLDNADGTTEDLGINTYCGKMISVWGRVASHLHRMRLGKVETPWLPGSTFSRLNLSLYEYEAQLHHKHLLRNLFPSRRPPEEIKNYLEYWQPWLTTHMTLHASLALINHPFIHLVTLRRKKGVCQSRLFLQQVVDQALFHAGWVFWLVQMFEHVSFEICNPLLGLVVAATATIPWLYQFAKDAKVSRKAIQDLDRCERFLQRLSVTWPHIAQKLDHLRKLKSLVTNSQQDVPGKTARITFPSSMLWELLDPSICETVPSGSQPSAPSEASIHVTTHFLHPLADECVQQRPANDCADDLGDTFMPSQIDLQRAYMDGSLFPFDYDDAQEYFELDQAPDELGRLS